MHYFKNSGMKDPIEELSFFNLQWLKYLVTNYIYFMKMQNYFQYYKLVTYVYRWIQTNAERERERERERLVLQYFVIFHII